MQAQNVQMARFKVKAESAGEFEEAAKHAFAAVQQEQPKRIHRYTICRLSDGVTYAGLLELDDGVDNSLPALPEGKKFLESLRNWIAEPPVRDELTVIGSYRFFGEGILGSHSKSRQLTAAIVVTLMPMTDGHWEAKPASCEVEV